MSPFREAGPQNNIEFEKKVQEFFKDTINDFKDKKYEVSPAEAIFLKQMVRDIINENDTIRKNYEKTGKENMDLMPIYPEIKERFFIHYYGISYDEYMRQNKDRLGSLERKKAEEDFFEHVKNLRKDRELM